MSVGFGGNAIDEAFLWTKNQTSVDNSSSQNCYRSKYWPFQVEFQLWKGLDLVFEG